MENTFETTTGRFSIRIVDDVVSIYDIRHNDFVTSYTTDVLHGTYTRDMRLSLWGDELVMTAAETRDLFILLTKVAKARLA